MDDQSSNAARAPKGDHRANVSYGYLRRWSDEAADEAARARLLTAGARYVFEDVLDDKSSPTSAFYQVLEGLSPDDVLIVPSLDHAARSLRQLDVLLQQLQACGARLFSLTEGLQAPGRDSTMTFGESLSILRAFERRIVSDRTRRSLHRAAAQGRRGGREVLLTGRKLATVKRLLAERQLTIEQIAAKVGVSAATIYRHMPAPRGRR